MPLGKVIRAARVGASAGHVHSSLGAHQGMKPKKKKQDEKKKQDDAKKEEERKKKQEEEKKKKEEEEKKEKQDGDAKKLALPQEKLGGREQIQAWYKPKGRKQKSGAPQETEIKVAKVPKQTPR